MDIRAAYFRVICNHCTADLTPESFPTALPISDHSRGETFEISRIVDMLTLQDACPGCGHRPTGHGIRVNVVLSKRPL